ncbi:MAG: glutathione peroxidase [Geobacter sp.]|nr:glutathione peroxidase [Geobacter sp.]
MDIYSVEVTTIDGVVQSMDSYRGKMLLVVNVASRCGFTSQYAGLQALYDAYRGKGLVVLGFPCDQFGHQEPADEEQIKNFCSLTYNVTFPMFSKIEVNGSNAHPLYRYLKSAKKGLLGTEAVKWNFTKFLVDRDGTVLKRYAPTDTPDSIAADLSVVLT